MATRHTLSLAAGRVEEIERYPSIDDRIREVALWAREDPDARSPDFATGDRTGELVATAFFGPEMELFVTRADGRRLTFEMPENYRE